MSVTIRQLATLIQGQVYGDEERIIVAARPLSEAKAGDVTFIENDKHLRHLLGCKASAIVLPSALIPQLPCGPSMQDAPALIAVEDPLAAFVVLMRHFRGPEYVQTPGIDSRADINPEATLGDGVSVSPFVSIGAGTVIGARCQLNTGVVIGRNCQIGDDVILYPNVVLYDDTVPW